MANDANIKAVITAEDRASSVLRGFGDNVNGVAGKVGSVLKVAAEGALVAGAAVTTFGVLSVKAFSESQDKIAQTNAVLKSTGGIAGVTADQVDKLSKALQRTTKYSDEDVRSVENLLLTFTSISKDIFPQATSTVLDMATALGEDTKSASIQLGKALQDPILGITALRRVGVNFSDAQKDVIKNLVETGHKAEAQKAILKELNVEFGGSAVAAGNTFAGSLAKLKNAFNDIQETIGATIVNYLTPLVQKLADVANSINWNQVIQTTVAAISSFISTVTNLYNAVTGYLTPGITSFINTLQNIANILNTWVGPSLNALISTLQDRLLPQIIAVWNTIEPAFTTALKILADVVGVIVVAALWVFINTLNVVASVLGFVIRVINDLINWIGNLSGVIINVFRGIPNFLQDALKDVYWIIAGPYIAAFNAIKSGVEDVKRSISSIKGGAANLGQDILDPFHLLHRAAGGPVTSGTPYLVGEQGPELMIPNQSGTIIPNNRLGGESGTNVSINININAGALMGNDVEARKFALLINKHLNEARMSKMGAY